MSLPEIPAGQRSVTPHLTVRGAAAAIEFYAKAFGAKEVRRQQIPGQEQIMFAEIEIGDSRVYLNDEFPEHQCLSPLAFGNSPVTLHLFVANADAAFDKAVAAGATATVPLQDMFWGDRYGQVVDPFGHKWSIASPLDKLSSEAIRNAEACQMGNVA